MAKAKNDIADKILSADVDLPHAAEIVSHFMAACGGPSEFSKLMFEEFSAANPGSVTRQRIMDMVLKLMNKAQDDMPSTPPLGSMNDEDLRRTLSEIMATRHGKKT